MYAAGSTRDEYSMCSVGCIVLFMFMCATKEKSRSVLSVDMRCIEFERQVPKNTTLFFLFVFFKKKGFCFL